MVWVFLTKETPKPYLFLVVFLLLSYGKYHYMGKASIVFFKKKFILGLPPQGFRRLLKSKEGSGSERTSKVIYLKYLWKTNTNLEIVAQISYLQSGPGSN